MSITGNPNASLNFTLNNLVTTDYALPNLWDARFQQILDNDAVLNKGVQDILAGKGAIKRLQSLAQLSALRAYKGMVDGETVYIEGYGVYRYYAAASNTARDPLVVQPDQGAGRWLLEMIPVALMGTAGGVALLDSEGFLNQSLADNSIAGSKLRDNAVSDPKLASVTIAGNATPNADTAKPGVLLDWLASLIRGITGNASWRTAAPVSLTTLNQKAGRIDKTQTWNEKQTMAQVEVTGDLILPVR